MRRATLLMIAVLSATAAFAQKPAVPVPAPPAPVAAVPATTTPVPLVQADARTKAVVEKLVTAYGGGTRLARVRSVYDVVITKEKTTAGSRDVTVTALYVFPDKVWAKLDGEKSATMVVLPWNAFVKSTDLPAGAAMKMPDEQREQLMRRMDVDPVFVLARRLFSSNRFAARDPRVVDGKRVDVLDVITNGRESTWLVDPESGRLLRASAGDDEVRYTDWRTVKGLNVPHKMAIHRKGGDVQWFLTSACDFDVMYDDTLFREPTIWFNPELDLSQSYEWYNWYRAIYYRYTSWYRY
ncbi:MAG TPA: hypothetical protein VGF69_07250 [Thermoanaerobaculia bacterium]|jgi:hypothetical protein